MKQGTDAWQRVLETDTRAQEMSPEAAAIRLPCLTIIYHPDVQQIGRRALLPLPGERQVTSLSRGEPLFGGRDSAGPLADPFLSRQPLLLRGTREALHLETRGSSTHLEVDGARVSSSARVELERLEPGVILTLGNRVVLVLHWGPPVPPSPVETYGLVGESPKVTRVHEQIQRLAPLSAAILIRGETGTGKELAAKALHGASPRANQPFISVNMAAVPPSLAASELFGASRGAFTGADRARRGFFGRAEGGTLFLDEIGETPADVQPLLLRALESGEIQPVGADGTKPTDVRVIAATDLDLESAVERGKFRTPLLHRLQALTLELPSLRERREDLGRLLIHFLQTELTAVDALAHLSLARPDAPPWLPAHLVARMALAEWPGNVRQLRNSVRQVVALGHDAPQVPEAVVAELSANLCESSLEAPGPAAMAGPRAEAKARRKPAEIPHDEVVTALRQHRWRIKPAADALGISRPSLYERIVEHPELNLARDLSADELNQAHVELQGDLDKLVDRFEVSPEALRRRLRELGLES